MIFEKIHDRRGVSFKTLVPDIWTDNERFVEELNNSVERSLALLYRSGDEWIHILPESVREHLVVVCEKVKTERRLTGRLPEGCIVYEPNGRTTAERRTIHLAEDGDNYATRLEVYTEGDGLSLAEVVEEQWTPQNGNQERA